MTNNNNNGHQDWAYIFGFGILTFIIVWLGLVYAGWNIANDLPPIHNFLDVLMIILNSIREYFFEESITAINTFMMWLDNGYLWDTVLHIGLPAIPAAWTGYKVGSLMIVPGGLGTYIHVDGPKLLEGKAAINHAKHQAKKQSSPLGLRLHPKIRLPRAEENGNILIMGNHGTGKSAFQIPLFSQIIDRGSAAFIFDYKGEYTAQFYVPEKTLLVSVTDERATPWNISADVTSPQLAMKVATLLITDGSTHDTLWSNGSRLIVAGIMTGLIREQRPWGWEDLARFLQDDNTDNLKHFLQTHYPLASAFIIDNENKMTQSFMATLKSHIPWVIELAQAWPQAYINGFSVMEWVQQNSSQQPVLIIQHSEAFSPIAAPMTNALLELIYTALTTQEPNPNQAEFWLLLDELGHLPKNSTLESWLSTGRAYGARTVIGTQNLSKLLSIYGEHLTHAIFDLFEVVVAFRLSGSATADYIVKRCGERTVRRPKKPDEKLQPSEERLPVLKTTDLIHLPKPDPAQKYPIHAYVMIQGWKAVYKLTFPFFQGKSKSVAHIPSAFAKGQLAQPTTKPTAATTFNPLQALQQQNADMTQTDTEAG